LGGQPASHPKRDKRGACGQANDGSTPWPCRHGHGRGTAVARYRWLPDVLLLDGKETVAVHGCERTVVNATTGAQLYHHSLITHPQVTADNVAEGAHAGRGRWKIAHAHHQVLKAQGDHIAPNLGHGQQYLAARMLSLTLLAVLCHTVGEWSDATYLLLRQVLARRPPFFAALRALRRSLAFDSGQHLRECMIRGLELESRLALQPTSKRDTS
jgi:hypothetical protein